MQGDKAMSMTTKEMHTEIDALNKVLQEKEQIIQSKNEVIKELTKQKDVLKANPVPQPLNPKKSSKYDPELILNLKAQGVTVNQIAKAYGCSESTIYSVLKQYKKAKEEEFAHTPYSTFRHKFKTVEEFEEAVGELTLEEIGNLVENEKAAPGIKAAISQGVRKIWEKKQQEKNKN